VLLGTRIARDRAGHRTTGPVRAGLVDSRSGRSGRSGGSRRRGGRSGRRRRGGRSRVRRPLLRCCWACATIQPPAGPGRTGGIRCVHPARPGRAPCRRRIAHQRDRGGANPEPPVHRSPFPAAPVIAAAPVHPRPLPLGRPRATALAVPAFVGTAFLAGTALVVPAVGLRLELGRRDRSGRHGRSGRNGRPSR
jgi:hypothetical protein